MIAKFGLKAFIILGVIASTIVFDPSDAQALWRRRRAYSGNYNSGYNTSYSSDCGCNSGGAMSSTQYQGSPQYAERSGGDSGYRGNQYRETDRGSSEAYQAR